MQEIQLVFGNTARTTWRLSNNYVSQITKGVLVKFSDSQSSQTGPLIKF